jgi:hypothetical protein
VKSPSEIAAIADGMGFTEFVKLAMLVMRNDSLYDAAAQAEAKRAPEPVRTSLKAAVQSGASTGTWGGELVGSADLVGPFLRALRNSLDAFHALHGALGVRPWEESPLYADTAEPPSWMLGDQWRCNDWRKAWELRCEILEAMK